MKCFHTETLISILLSADFQSAVRLISMLEVNCKNISSFHLVEETDGQPSQTEIETETTPGTSFSQVEHVENLATTDSPSAEPAAMDTESTRLEATAKQSPLTK